MPRLQVYISDAEQAHNELHACKRMAVHSVNPLVCDWCRRNYMCADWNDTYTEGVCALQRWKCRPDLFANIGRRSINNNQDNHRIQFNEWWSREWEPTLLLYAVRHSQYTWAMSIAHTWAGGYVYYVAGTRIFRTSMGNQIKCENLFIFYVGCQSWHKQKQEQWQRLMEINEFDFLFFFSS